MISREEWSSANLTFFLSDRWEREIAAARGIENEKDTLREEVIAHYHLSLLESFQWLQLGTRIGFFPQKLVDPLIMASGPVLQRVYRDTVKTVHYQRLARNLQIDLHATLGGEIRPIAVDASDVLSNTVGSAFRSILTLSNGFAQSEDARGFVQSVVFSNVQIWEATKLALAHSSSANEREQSVRQSISTGLVAVVDYMNAYRELRFGLQERGSTTTNQRALLETVISRAQAIQQWRFSVYDSFVLRKFLEAFNEVIINFLDAEGVGPALASKDLERLKARLIEELWSLLIDWGALRTRSIGA